MRAAGRGMASPDTLPLLERDEDVARLAAAADRARSGTGGVVVVEGPAGIGKSGLLAAASRRYEREGLLVCAARAGELERELPYGVVRDLLGGVLLRAGASDRDRLLSGPAAHVRPLFAPGPGGADEPASSSEAVLFGLYWLVANLALDRSLALVVDDVQWADEPSLRCLAFLGSRLIELPALLALGVRLDEPTADDELVGRLRALAGSAVLRPKPLSRAAVGQLVAAHLGETPDQRFVERTHEVTGGNPFYLRELLVDAAAHRLPPDAAHLDRLEELGARTLSERLARRLRTLGPDATATAQAVAVLGDDAEIRHVAAVTGCGLRATGAAADALARASLLRLSPDGRLGFTHPIVRAAVYAGLDAGRRSDVHADAASVLRADGAPPERVASHLVSTFPAGNLATVQRLEQAATAAESRGAVQAAVTYLARAVAEPPPLAERARVLMRLGEVQFKVGHPEAVDTLRRAGEQAGDARLRAQIAGLLAVALIAAHRPAEAAVVVRAALEGLGDDDREVALSLQAEALAWIGRDLPGGDWVIEVAERNARRAAGETPGERKILAALAVRTKLRGDARAEQAVDYAERALAEGTLLAEDGCESTSFWSAIDALIGAERISEARRHIADGRAQARARSSALASAVLEILDGYAAQRVGEPLAVEASMRTALTLCQEHGWHHMTPVAVSFLTDALIERDALDQAAAELLRYTPGDGSTAPEIAVATGILHVERGNEAEGLRVFQALVDEEIPWIHSTVAGWRPAAVRALLAAGRRDDARAMAEEELQAAERWGSPRVVGIARHAAALAVGDRAGRRLLESAVEVLERSCSRLELAKALLSLGADLRRRNQRVPAREPLTRAVDLAAACGAMRVARVAQQELVAAGARPRRVRTSGVESLTAMQRRVADLAAGGASNREIAQTLFVTRKTVESHLHAAYGKLDVRSRDELADKLAGRRSPE